MTKSKKECFFVWRTVSNGKLRAMLTCDGEDSRAYLDLSIAELDPFQNATQREWQSARTFLSLDRVAS